MNRHINYLTILTRTWMLSILLHTMGCKAPVPPEVEHALRVAGTHREELQKVIDHYAAYSERLKLRAAYFLIGNMLHQSHATDNDFFESLLAGADSLRLSGSEVNEHHMEDIWVKLKKTKSPYDEFRALDLQSISSELLIENIDQAFLAWEKAPWATHFTFDQFCEYVLPYRSVYQRPTQWRKRIREKYQPVLVPNQDVLATVDQLNDSMRWFKYWGRMADISEVSLQDLYQLQKGTCNHHSNLKISLLRSVGIPAATVFARPGTSWVTVMNEDGTHVDYGSHFTPKVGEYYRDVRSRWFPKIFMDTYQLQPLRFPEYSPNELPNFFFNPMIKDVTAHHTPVSDVDIELTIAPPEATGLVFLCVFDKTDWLAVDVTEVKNSTASFKNMGVNNIYLPAHYLSGKYYPAATPFYLNEQGDVSWLKADTTQWEKVKLTRKFPISIPARKYSDLMVGTIFEGSNSPDFNSPVHLATILETPRDVEYLHVETSEPFRYVRYKTDTLMGVAELMFWDDQMKPLTGKILHSPQLKEEAKHAFDGSIRTNCNNDQLQVWNAHDNAFDEALLESQSFDSISWVGLDLGTPTVIGKVGYLFRNSWNVIEPEHQYELYYWDKEWKSLGKQTANQYHLSFEVPQNALLLLKNLTEGVQDYPFFMQGEKQKWGGYYE